MTAMNYQKRNNYERGLNGTPLNREEFKITKKAKKPKIKKKVKKFSAKQRTNLRVPYSEKDKAKALGAKWDAKKKVWYCVGSTNRLQKWL